MSLLQIHEPGQTPLPHASEQTLAIGIDLGTTHSVASYVDAEGEVVYITDAQGRAIHPSIVQLAGEDIYSIKRQMSISPATVYAVDKTPVEISAEILRHLKSLAEMRMKQEVTEAVITVPAHFDDSARTATKDAARLAGLNVLRLVNEPTAAALAYGLDNEAEGIYAIYDLGGGTFDISILRLEKGVFQVLSTHGDTALGGDDFDEVMQNLSLWERSKNAPQLSGEGRVVDNETASPHPNPLPEGEGMTAQQARAFKEKLSSEESVEINGQTLTRQQFETAIAPLIQRTLNSCQQALSDAGLSKQEVNGVVLVGGSTRVPAVQRAVEAFFEQVPHTEVDPDRVVAVGAALQAKALTRGSDTLLLDVIPLSLGLETMGGLVEKVIYRNSPIPCSAQQEFTTYQDGQTAMLIHVVQGEREMVDQCRSLARFTLRGIPPLVAGSARITVTFTVDADGLLSVSAREETTGTVQHVDVKPSYGLSDEQMMQMLRESMQHAKDDITQRLLVEARVEAERLIRDLRAAMAESKNLLNAEEIKALEAGMAALSKAKSSENRDIIDAVHKQLEQKAAQFAQRRMDSAIASALEGKEIEKL